MASKPATKPAAETKDYEVLSKLDHDNEPYLPGETVALTDAQAEPLLGTVVKLKPAAEKPAGQ